MKKKDLLCKNVISKLMSVSCYAYINQECILSQLTSHLISVKTMQVTHIINTDKTCTNKFSSWHFNSTTTNLYCSTNDAKAAA